MREAQQTMSSTASNYDVQRLFFGTSLAFLICVLSYFALPTMRPMSPAGLYYALTLALYAVLMFASSYVEEEHNFWYWITSGWFFYLFIASMRKEWTNNWLFHPALMALLAHRVIRRWNQTGQKYAGADDIVTSGIFHGPNSILLWALIGATYIDVTTRISKHVARSLATFDSAHGGQAEHTEGHRMAGTVAIMPLCGTAFVFKLAFTGKDAPELTYAVTPSLMEWADTLNLVGLARMVFAGIALSGCWIALGEWQRSRKRAQKGTKGQGGTSRTSFNKTSLIRSQILPLLFST
jgi:ethanolaminephosphotransferase